MNAVATTVTVSRRGQAWTAEEVEFLLANRSNLSPAQMATVLQRDEAGVLVRLRVEIESLRADGDQHRREMARCWSGCTHIWSGARRDWHGE